MTVDSCKKVVVVFLHFIKLKYILILLYFKYFFSNKLARSLFYKITKNRSSM